MELRDNPPAWSARLQAVFGRHALLLLAVGLAAVFQVIIAVRSEIIAPDGVLFIQIAKALAEDPIDTCRTEPQHPGYPAAVLGTVKLLSSIAGRQDVYLWILAGRIFAGLCGVACVIFVWLFARRLFSPKIANLAAIIFAGLPLYRQNAADVLSDSPHLLCYLVASWAIAEGLVRRSFSWWMIAGTCSGLAFWIRPEGLGVAIVAALTLLACLFIGQYPKQRLIAHLVVLCTSVAIVVLPYVLLTGRLTSKKTRAVSAATWKLGTIKTVKRGQQIKPAKIKPSQADLAQAVIRIPSLRSWASACGDLLAKLSHSLRYVLVAPLLVGLVASRRHLASTHQLLMLALVASNVVLLVGQYLYDESVGSNGYVEYRHLMPLVAIAMPCIALGSWLLAEGTAWLMRHAVSAQTVSATLTSLCLAGMVPWTTRPLHQPMVAVRDAAEWVKSKSAPGSLLLTNSFYIAFYSEAENWIFRDRVSKLQDEARHSVEWPGRVVIVVDAAAPDGPKLRRRLKRFDLMQVMPCGTARKPRELLMLVRAEHPSTGRPAVAETEQRSKMRQGASNHEKLSAQQRDVRKAKDSKHR